MIDAKPVSAYLLPALLLVGAGLAGFQWYLQPGRAAGPASLVLLAAMAIALAVADRWSRMPARHRDAAAIRSAIALVAFSLALALGLQVARASGALNDAELARRMTMAMLGLLFAYVGNVLPRQLVPLSALRCDGARLQAFQRFAGRTWVLAGLAYATIWLTAPIVWARPVSMVVLMSGMLLVAAQLLRLRRAR